MIHIYVRKKPIFTEQTVKVRLLAYSILFAVTDNNQA